MYGQHQGNTRTKSNHKLNFRNIKIFDEKRPLGAFFCHGESTKKPLKSSIMRA